MLSLLEHDYTVVVMDNLDNSFQKAYDRMVELAGDRASNMRFIKVGSGPIAMPSRRSGACLCLKADSIGTQECILSCLIALQGDLRNLDDLEKAFEGEK